MIKNRILSIDYGSKTIGIAISDNSNKFAIPYTEIENNQKTLAKIKEIVDEENISQIILGYPITRNNYVSERHQMILDFYEKLLNLFEKNIKIILYDESYSTSSSFESLKSFNVKTSRLKKNKDMIAASIILENFLKK